MVDLATGQAHSYRYYLPAEHASPVAFAEALLSDLGDLPVKKVFIERFVSYQGKFVTTAESTCLLIGVLAFALREKGPLYLMRATDWKVKAVHLLRRENGFLNPSTKLDKKFSIAAARSICPTFSGTDHEADALVMAWVGAKVT